MKKMQHGVWYSLWLTIPLSFVLFLFTVTSSCTGNKKKGSSFHFTFDTLKTKFNNATCITLTRSQLNREWVREFTHPDNTAERKIKVIKFFTDVSSAENSFVVKAQAFNESNIPLGKEIVMGSGENCGKNLPPYFRGLSNEVVFSDLDIIVKETGRLKDNFIEIILNPYVTNSDGYSFLAFEVFVKDGTFPRVFGNSLPCPPCINCKLCPKICDNKCDSTVTVDDLPLKQD